MARFVLALALLAATATAFSPVVPIGASQRGVTTSASPDTVTPADSSSTALSYGYGGNDYYDDRRGYNDYYGGYGYGETALGVLVVSAGVERGDAQDVFSLHCLFVRMI